LAIGHDRGAAWSCWAGPVSWTGQGEKQVRGEREERGTRGWTERGEEKDNWLVMKILFFFFLKILNNTKFVYFIVNYL
jgi:hypothetical protein